MDLEKLPGLTLHIDCDVLDADGGTRCASITGASLALELAVARLIKDGILTENPLLARVAAVSVGMLQREGLLDLCYVEDAAADVDMNVIMTDKGRYVELQGSGEEATFSDDDLTILLNLAKNGLKTIFDLQGQALRNYLEN